MGKIDRREFWVRLLAPVAAFFGVGSRFKNVLISRCYVMSEPFVPGARLIFKDPVLNRVVERLGRNSAEYMDRIIREVVENG